MKRGMVTISKLLNGERNKVLDEVETIIECELTESVYRKLPKTDLLWCIPKIKSKIKSLRRSKNE